MVEERFNTLFRGTFYIVFFFGMILIIFNWGVFHIFSKGFSSLILIIGVLGLLYERLKKIKIPGAEVDLDPQDSIPRYIIEDKRNQYIPKSTVSSDLEPQEISPCDQMVLKTLNEILEYKK